MVNLWTSLCTRPMDVQLLMILKTEINRFSYIEENKRCGISAGSTTIILNMIEQEQGAEWPIPAANSCSNIMFLFC